MTTFSPDDNISYEQLLIYYEETPKDFFWKHYQRIGNKHPYTFKVSYKFRKGIGHGFEKFYVESTMMEKIMRKEV